MSDDLPETSDQTSDQDEDPTEDIDQVLLGGDTDDLSIVSDDTIDVSPEDTVDTEEIAEDTEDGDDDTTAGSKKKKSPRRVRLPSKVEIMEYVDRVDTESLEVVTREDAQDEND